MKITEYFYRDLYEQQEESSKPVPVKVLNQTSEDIPEITEE